MEKLGINLGFLVFQIANFLIVLILLRAWAYNPIVKGLEDRKKKIAQGLEDARIAAEARANAEKEAAKIIADAQNEANKRVAESTSRAEKAAADVRAAADAEGKRLIAAAKEEAAQERDRALSDVRGQIGGLVVAAANNVIRETLDAKRQQALIDEFFSGVKAGKVVVGSGSANGGEAEVTSALPLSDSEKDTVKKDLGASSVAFKVDPNILGGLVVRIGDKVVDGSVAGKLEGLRQAIK